LHGRGAWLCRESPACVEAGVRRRAFERALRGPISPEAVKRLRENAANRVSMMVTEAQGRAEQAVAEKDSGL
jgi:predicted RNA-binding protein YlxR (DUF448 family)